MKIASSQRNMGTAIRGSSFGLHWGDKRVSTHEENDHVTRDQDETFSVRWRLRAGDDVLIRRFGAWRCIGERNRDALCIAGIARYGDTTPDIASKPDQWFKNTHLGFYRANDGYENSCVCGESTGAWCSQSSFKRPQSDQFDAFDPGSSG